MTEVRSEVPASPVGTAKKPTNWASEIWQLFLLVLAVLAIHSFVAKPFFIPSGSMLPSLLIGDRLIVSKFPYGFSYLSPSSRRRATRSIISSASSACPATPSR